MERQQPSEPSGRSLARILRSHLVLVLLGIALGAAIALGLSLRQDKTYEAKAAVSFLDQSANLIVTGVAVAPQQPDSVAAAGAQTLAQAAVRSTTRERIGNRLSTPQIGKRVAISANSSSNLVEVTATDDSAAHAAQLANAYAQAGVDVATRSVHLRYGRLAKAFQARLRNRKTNPVRAVQEQDQLQRLLALSTVAEPATLAQRASPPSSPSSPKTAFNTLLGGVSGLILVVMAVFVRDAREGGFRDIEEVQDAFAYPVLGIVAEETLGTVPFLGQNKAKNVMGSIEAFRMLRANVGFLDVDQPPRCVAVTSPLPQEGKSTVAAALAFAAAAEEKRALLVECDLRRPTQRERLGLETGPGLSEYLADQAIPADVLRRLSFSDAPSVNGAGPEQQRVGPGVTEHELHCVLAGTPTTHAAEMLRSQRFRDFLAQVRGAYDIVVLDCGPMLPVADTLGILPEADGIVLCVRLNQTARHALEMAGSTLQTLPKRPTGIVVTAVSLRGHHYQYGYGYGYGTDKVKSTRS